MRIFCQLKNACVARSECITDKHIDQLIQCGSIPLSKVDDNAMPSQEAAACFMASLVVRKQAALDQAAEERYVGKCLLTQKPDAEIDGCPYAITAAINMDRRRFSINKTSLKSNKFRYHDEKHGAKKAENSSTTTTAASSGEKK
jgi:hypothetical protein